GGRAASIVALNMAEPTLRVVAGGAGQLLIAGNPADAAVVGAEHKGPLFAGVRCADTFMQPVGVEHHGAHRPAWVERVGTAKAWVYAGHPAGGAGHKLRQPLGTGRADGGGPPATFLVDRRCQCADRCLQAVSLLGKVGKIALPAPGIGGDAVGKGRAAAAE